MAVKHIYIAQLGNKQTDIKFFNKYLPLDIKIVVEPFAGSFAIIRNIYYDNKYIRHINDINVDIYNILNNYDDYINEYNKIIDYVNQHNTGKNAQIIKQDILLMDLKHKNKIIENIIIRGMIKKHMNKISVNDKLISLLKNSIITCDDYINVIEKYKDNEDAFIFLDPPYLASHNVTYMLNSIDDKKNVIDNTEIYIKIYEYFKICKCKLMLIINGNAINRYIFKDYIVGDYNRCYQMTKHKEQLLICINYKI